jgi:hypothetical protein
MKSASHGKAVRPPPACNGTASTTTPSGTRACSQCQEVRPKDRYSGAQWKKNSQTRLCKDCQELKKHPADTDSVANSLLRRLSLQPPWKHSSTATTQELLLGLSYPPVSAFLEAAIPNASPNYYQEASAYALLKRVYHANFQAAKVLLQSYEDDGVVMAFHDILKTENGNIAAMVLTGMHKAHPFHTLRCLKKKGYQFRALILGQIMKFDDSVPMPPWCSKTTLVSFLRELAAPMPPWANARDATIPELAAGLSHPELSWEIMGSPTYYQEQSAIQLMLHLQNTTKLDGGRKAPAKLLKQCSKLGVFATLRMLLWHASSKVQCAVVGSLCIMNDDSAASGKVLSHLDDGVCQARLAELASEHPENAARKWAASILEDIKRHESWWFCGGGKDTPLAKQMSKEFRFFISLSDIEGGQEFLADLGPLIDEMESSMEPCEHLIQEVIARFEEFRTRPRLSGVIPLPKEEDSDDQDQGGGDSGEDDSDTCDGPEDDDAFTDTCGHCGLESAPLTRVEGHKKDKIIGPRFSQCARCYMTRYCSVECQQASFAEHKPRCAIFRMFTKAGAKRLKKPGLPAREVKLLKMAQNKMKYEMPASVLFHMAPEMAELQLKVLEASMDLCDAEGRFVGPTSGCARRDGGHY